MTSEHARTPPDRAHVLTEHRNPRTESLHTLSAAEIVRLIHEEDRAAFDAISAAEESLSALIHAIEPRFLAGGRLIYLGAGSSGRLGVLDASECPPTFQIPHGRVVGIIAGGDAALRRSSEGLEDDANGASAELAALHLTARDSVIGIAAGGTTPYVLGGLSQAHAESALTGLISCSPVVGATSGHESASAGVPASSAGLAAPSPASEQIRRVEHVDHVVYLPTGPEVVTGSTRMKAGTATKLALNTISTTLMIRSGRVYQNLMVDVRATNAKLRDRAARIISTLTGLSREDAFVLLEAAGGVVKVGVVMHERKLSRLAAEAMLEASDGHLDRALTE